MMLVVKQGVEDSLAAAIKQCTYPGVTIHHIEAKSQNAHVQLQRALRHAMSIESAETVVCVTCKGVVSTETVVGKKRGRGDIEYTTIAYVVLGQG
jgi:hypothetical protein